MLREFNELAITKPSVFLSQFLDRISGRVLPTLSSLEATEVLKLCNNDGYETLKDLICNSAGLYLLLTSEKHTRTLNTLENLFPFERNNRSHSIETLEELSARASAGDDATSTASIASDVSITDIVNVNSKRTSDKLKYTQIAAICTACTAGIDQDSAIKKIEVIFARKMFTLSELLTAFKRIKKPSSTWMLAYARFLAKKLSKHKSAELRATVCNYYLQADFKGLLDISLKERGATPIKLREIFYLVAKESALYACPEILESLLIYAEKPEYRGLLELFHPDNIKKISEAATQNPNEKVINILLSHANKTSSQNTQIKLLTYILIGLYNKLYIEYERLQHNTTEVRPGSIKSYSDLLTNRFSQIDFLQAINVAAIVRAKINEFKNEFVLTRSVESNITKMIATTPMLDILFDSLNKDNFILFSFFFNELCAVKGLNRYLAYKLYVQILDLPKRIPHPEYGINTTYAINVVKTLANDPEELTLFLVDIAIESPEVFKVYLSFVKNISKTPLEENTIKTILDLDTKLRRLLDEITEKESDIKEMSAKRVSAGAGAPSCDEEKKLEIIAQTKLTTTNISRALTILGNESLTVTNTDIVLALTKFKKEHNATVMHDALTTGTFVTPLFALDTEKKPPRRPKTNSGTRIPKPPETPTSIMARERMVSIRGRDRNGSGSNCK